MGCTVDGPPGCSGHPLGGFKVPISEELHPWLAGKGALVWAGGNPEGPEACGQVCSSSRRSYNNRSAVQEGDLGRTVAFHSTWAPTPDGKFA